MRCTENHLNDFNRQINNQMNFLKNIYQNRKNGLLKYSINNQKQNSDSTKLTTNYFNFIWIEKLNTKSYFN